MELKDKVNLILADDYLDSEECEESKCEKIETLISLYGWNAVQKTIMNVLEDGKRTLFDCQVAAEVFWGAILDKRDISNANRVIALLYHRLQNDEPNSENDLAWSIVCKLKDLDYLSKYNPLEDPEIVRELNTLTSV